ncbi:MAG: alpha-amylase/4-alpha-glucanotransferase domain-containing protein, partial [Fidelibacterota bacterium]
TLEYRLNSEEISAIFTERGGLLRELDYWPAKFNLLNSVRRYRESYHERVANASLSMHKNGSIHEQLVAKEKGLEQLLAVDQAPRFAFLDRFFSAEMPVHDLKKQFPEEGNFLTRVFQVNQTKDLIFTACGSAFGKKAKLIKTIVLEGNTIQLNVEIRNEDYEPIEGWYGNEMNLSLLGGHTPDRYYEINGKRPRRSYLDSTGAEKKVREIALINSWDRFRVIIRFQDPASIWRFPLETVTMSESGLERIYQSSVLIPYWRLELKPGQAFMTTFTLGVESMQ